MNLRGNNAGLLSVDPETTSRDLARVEELLKKSVRSTDTLPRELADYLVSSGGKRIRPLLMILTYRGFANGAARISSDDLHTLASVAEWTHTATLFHDDVLDASDKRRDKTAAHILHGNKVAILVGDFVYAEAFALLMERGLLEPSRELATTIKTLVEGELLQHKVVQTRSLDLREYERTARAKTAALFAWCTWTGAWGAGVAEPEAARDFGALLGYAFQMADDLFDTYSLDPETAGERELVEWAESSPPLPVVEASLGQPEIARLWNELPKLSGLALRAPIARLHALCLNPAVVETCEKRIHATLAESESKLARLGDNASLAHAALLIRARGEEGLAVARSKVLRRAV
jgi:octaprenyl-diphosphate synthase